MAPISWAFLAVMQTHQLSCSIWSLCKKRCSTTWGSWGMLCCVEYQHSRQCHRTWFTWYSWATAAQASYEKDALLKSVLIIIVYKLPLNTAAYRLHSVSGKFSNWMYLMTINTYVIQHNRNKTTHICYGALNSAQWIRLDYTEPCAVSWSIKHNALIIHFESLFFYVQLFVLCMLVRVIHS